MTGVDEVPVIDLHWEHPLVGQTDVFEQIEAAAPYYSDDSVTLWHGDARDVLPTLPDGSVDCIVTSPPYYGLRDYGIPNQIGLEASPLDYVEALRALFSDVRRALADDGVLWLNLGDTYSTRVADRTSSHQDGLNGDAYGKDWRRDKDLGRTRMPTFLPEKNLMGIPWRVAFALQDDGWILRNDTIWHKPNGMPDSVGDRLSMKHEYVFLFSKSHRYWFDLDPIREPLLHPEKADGSIVFGGKNKAAQLTTGSSARTTGAVYKQRAGADKGSTHPAGRNPGDVWTIPTTPFRGAHFAVMPLALADRCIAAGCKPGGVVLDPFSGSGTTGLAATKRGHRYVGIDGNVEYLDLSLRTRLQQPGLIDERGSA